MFLLQFIPQRPGPTMADDGERLAAAITGQIEHVGGAARVRWFADAPTGGVAGMKADGELQALLADAGTALGLCLSVVRSGQWAVVLTVGTRGGMSWDTPGESSVLAPDERRRARSAPGGLLVHRPPVPEGRDGSEDSEVLTAVEATLQLVAVLERRRSAEQQEAGRLIESGASQREAASELGISQQAVHSRLRHGLWNESRNAVASVLPLLERLDAQAQEPSPRRPRNGDLHHERRDD